MEMRMEIKDYMSLLTGQIIQLRSYHHCLKTLFALEQGSWVAVDLLFKDTDELRKEIESLQTYEPPIDIYVNWVPFPQSGYGPGYAIITFFCETLHWSSVALYNKGHLDQIDV